MGYTAVFLFSILGMGVGSFELEKCNAYLQIFINLVKLLLFGKPFDLILSLNTLRKCSVFKASFKKFQSLFFKISQLANISHQLGIKDTFFALGMGPQKEHCTETGIYISLINHVSASHLLLKMNLLQ